MRNRYKPLITGWLLVAGLGMAQAQEAIEVVERDSLSEAVNNEMSILVDSARIPKTPGRDMSTWRPDPKRAL